MSKRQIKVRIVSQYGNKRILPACPTADLFCRIAGTSTLTNVTVDFIKQLGYTVQVVPEQVPVAQL